MRPKPWPRMSIGSVRGGQGTSKSAMVNTSLRIYGAVSLQETRIHNSLRRHDDRCCAWLSWLPWWQSYLHDSLENGWDTRSEILRRVKELCTLINQFKLESWYGISPLNMEWFSLSTACSPWAASLHLGDMIRRKAWIDSCVAQSLDLVLVARHHKNRNKRNLQAIEIP